MSLQCKCLKTRFMILLLESIVCPISMSLTPINRKPMFACLLVINIPRFLPLTSLSGHVNQLVQCKIANGFPSNTPAPCKDVLVWHKVKGRLHFALIALIPAFPPLLIKYLIAYPFTLCAA